MNNFTEVDLNQIEPNPWQPRVAVDMAFVEKLAADIRAHGLIHPPTGRTVGARFQLAAGHNRYSAFCLLSAEDDRYCTIPVQIVAYSDEQMALLAWAENEARQDLSPIDQAAMIQKAMDSFEWTQEEAAARFDIGRSTLANKLRLLTLPDYVQERVHGGEISERAAIALLPLYQRLGDHERRILARHPDSMFNEAKILEAATAGTSSAILRRYVDTAVKLGSGELAYCDVCNMPATWARNGSSYCDTHKPPDDVGNSPEFHRLYFYFEDYETREAVRRVADAHPGGRTAWLIQQVGGNIDLKVRER